MKSWLPGVLRTTLLEQLNIEGINVFVRTTESRTNGFIVIINNKMLYLTLIYYHSNCLMTSSQFCFHWQCTRFKIILITLN